MVKLNKYYFKVVIVGDTGVGKTTLLHQYLNKRFKSDAETTIGSNFFVKYVKLPNAKNLITLQVWDLAGQEHFKWVRAAFYKGARGVIYVYDLTQKESFYNLIKWKEEVESSIGIVPSVLVGNKLDLLESQNNTIDYEECLFLKNSLTARYYYETSAKLGTKVEEVFLKLTHLMFKIYQE
jgi:small GTP-binding protein